MERRSRPELLVSIAAALGALAFSAFALFQENLFPMLTKQGAAAGYVVAISALALTALFYYISFALRRYPTSLSIVLVGPPGVGKTVFLTILFRELETGQLKPLLFAPSGRFTTGEMARNIALMTSGHFPDPTPIETTTHYEAVARLGRLFPRQYRIRISDSAGEDMLTLGGSSWPHKSTFFEHMVSSDAILFMIDIPSLFESPDKTIIELENSMIAALNLVIEERNRDATQLFTIPVALLISKADMLWSVSGAEDDALDRVSNFIAIANRRCRRFRVFFVSSLGCEPTPKNAPPRRISPVGIVEPIEWILRG